MIAATVRCKYPRAHTSAAACRTAPDLQRPIAGIGLGRLGCVGLLGSALGAGHPDRHRTEVQVPRLAAAVGAARQVLRAWEGHFEPDLFYDLSLCVSELVTNRVRYGAASAGEEIELIVRRDEELVRVEVREPRAEDIMAAPLAEPLSDWGTVHRGSGRRPLGRGSWRGHGRLV